MKISPKIEICCSDIHSVELAANYGVDAIELCVDLEHGGLTPGLALIQKARKIFSRELVVFFRLRNGDFVYDRTEKEIMLSDMRLAIDSGVDTIVAGGLDPDGGLDLDFMNEIVGISMGNRIGFHRAIDLVSDPDLVFSQLIHLQIDRVLSSGQKTSAIEGATTLREWNQKYGDKIEIMAAGGIDHNHVIKLLNTTGLQRFHASLRHKIQSKSGIMDLGYKELIDEQKLKLLMKEFGR